MHRDKSQDLRPECMAIDAYSDKLIANNVLLMGYMNYGRPTELR